MLQSAKVKCLQDHVMKQRLCNLTKTRLKKRSFVHDSRMLQRQYQQVHPNDNLAINEAIEPWKSEKADVRICNSVPCVTTKDNQDDIVRRAFSLSMIEQKQYPSEAWTRVFTDGPATNAVTNVGTGIKM